MSCAGENLVNSLKIEEIEWCNDVSLKLIENVDHQLIRLNYIISRYGLGFGIMAY